MDRFFPEKLLGEIFWDEPPPTTNQSNFVQHSQDELFPPANHSAFVQYRDLPIIGFGEESSPNASHSQSVSMSKRMIAFLRKNWPVDRNNAAEHERERCFRHMISERMRRQRQRQCCLALHSMLPHGTKTDNNSVIQRAAKEIQRLQACREDLLRKNLLLEAYVESSQVVGSKLQYLRVPYPKSGIGSMVETLKFLKRCGMDTRSIKSNFSQEELFAVLEIESASKIEDDEVEKASHQRTLDEVEWKLHSHVKEGLKKQRLD